MTRKASVGIIGGGITGLSVAHRLHKAGVEVVVYEQKQATGGVIQSTRTDGWLVEHGPNTLMVRRQEVWDLLEDLQLGNVIERAGGESRKRFIVKDASPMSIPRSLREFITTDLFSARAKLRLLKEPFVSSSVQQDESIARFISRRLGREPLEYAVNPFVSGIYAGRPEQLSVKHTFSALWEMEQAHGSLLRGAINGRKKRSKTERALLSFREGMQALPRAICRQLGDRVRLNTTVQQISCTADGWVVKMRSPEGYSEQRHGAVVSTVPAHALAGLFDEAREQPDLASVAQIPYAPLSIIALGYRRSQVAHPLDGFGMLIPEAEAFQTLGTLFSSSLFSHRAPTDHVLLTSFIGGARNPDLAHKSEEELISIVGRELNRLLTIEGSPVFSQHVYWPGAIPQYEVGYDDHLNAMHRLEKHNEGLFLAGNFRLGVSVPDCIVNGIKMADRAARFLLS